MQARHAADQAGAQFGIDDGAQDGNAGDRAELAAGVGGRRGHPRPPAGNRREHRGGDRHDAGSDADAGQSQRGGERKVGRARADHQVRQQEPGGEQRAAADEQPADANRGCPPARQQCRDDHQRGHRQEHGRDAVARVAGDHAQVQHGEEEDRERGEVRAVRDHVGRREPRDPQVSQVKQRERGPALPEHEGRAGGYGHREQRQDAGRAVADRLTVDDAEDQGGQRAGAEHRACRVNPARSLVGALRQHPGRDDQRGQAEGHVEPEDPPPAPRPDQRPAQDRPEREREPGYRGPYPEGAVAAALVRVELPDHRQRAGLARRRPQPHDRACRDQHPGARRDRCQRRARAVDAGSDQHDLLAAELIAQHPEGQHEAGERQGVGPDHPLERGDAGVQVRLDAGQGDADDRVVEEGQEQQRAQGGEADGAAPRGEHASRGGRQRFGHRVSAGRRRAAGSFSRRTPGRPARRSSRRRLSRSRPGRPPRRSGSSAAACPAAGRRSAPWPATPT